jgi:hypothetical protein
MAILGAQHGDHRTPQTIPKIARHLDNCLGNKALAFNGQFHCVCGFGPEVGFIHIGILSMSAERTLPSCCSATWVNAIAISMKKPTGSQARRIAKSFSDS